MAKHKLFTAEIEKKLQAQYALGSDLENQKVIAKIFNPYGSGTWYLINQDPVDHDYLWCIANIFETEVGSVSKSELEQMRVKPFNLPLERDLYFDEQNAKEVFKKLNSGEHI